MTNSINNSLKKGDVIWMGTKRRTFLQWLFNKPASPQYWRIKDEYIHEPGAVNELERPV